MDRRYSATQTLAAVSAALALGYLMSKKSRRRYKNIKLTYFNFGGPAEAIRLTFTVGGIEFEDNRLSHEQFSMIKPTLPFGQVPFLEVDGDSFAQSTAILRFAGKLAGLYPEDWLEAARCDAIVDALVDMSHEMGPSLREKDPEKKMALRQDLATTGLPKWLGKLEAQLERSGGQHFANHRLTVADIAVAVRLRWLESGILDGIPTTITKAYPLLTRLGQDVYGHRSIAKYYSDRA